MRRRFVAAAAALALAACAPVARVTLLPDGGPQQSALEVSAGPVRHVLSRPYESAELSRTGELAVVASSEAEVARRYGALLALRPAAESRWLLNFAAATSSLTPESEALLPSIAAEVRRRPGGEVVVIGHTDSTGTTEANDALSLQRATAVRLLLIQSGVNPDLVLAIGRGKRELLVPTADQVNEPRNRRVEILVR